MSGEAHHGGLPSPWVLRFLDDLAAPSSVLDVAAGSGRHAIPLLDRGHPVTAVDRTISGLPPRAGLTVIAADLEGDAPWPLPGRTFDLVLVTNYLHRPLFPQLLASVAPRGLLLYETFAAGNERYGKPSNPAHLLRAGELLEVVRGAFEVLAYEHGAVTVPRPAVVQRIAARRSAD